MPEAALDTAYRLLAQVAAEMHDNGRRAHAAAVKPRLLALTNGGFDERSLDAGFRTFRDFVRAADAAGVITCAPAPIGPDIEVLPVGVTSLGPRQPVAQSERVRPDFWEAFVDWTPGRTRVYDRVEDRARIVPLEPAPLEPASHTSLRDALSDATRFVPITAVPMNAQAEWMRAFVDVAPASPGLAAAEAALQAERPFRAFAHALAIDDRLKHAYNDFRQEKVVEAIEAWRSDHGLEDVRIYTASTTPDHEDAKERGKSADENVRVEDIRRVVHAAVDRMPLDALNALHVPAEYYAGP